MFERLDNDTYEHLKKDQDAESLEAYLQTKADELYDGECSPDLPDNFCEAVSEMRDSDIKEAIKAAHGGDTGLFCAILMDEVSGYWKKRSREVAAEKMKRGDYDGY